MIVRTEDWHLLVLFNDPAHRFIPSENQEIIDDTYKDAEGVTWVRNIRGSKGQTYNSRVFWRDYGTIKDQSGVLIGFNLRILDNGQIPQNDNEITKEDILKLLEDLQFEEMIYLKELLAKNNGDDPVVVDFEDAESLNDDHRVQILTNKKLWVKAGSDVENTINKAFKGKVELAIKSLS